MTWADTTPAEPLPHQEDRLTVLEHQVRRLIQGLRDIELEVRRYNANVDNLCKDVHLVINYCQDQAKTLSKIRK